MEGWNVLDSQHTHTKLENDLEINNQLIINSDGGNSKSFLYRDYRRLWILTDRDGDGNFEPPHPLFIDHEVKAARLFEDLIWTEGNLPVETGTFTPQLRTIEDSTEPNYLQKKGTYYRVGSLCWLNFVLIVSSTIQSDSPLAIYNLPFNSATSDSIAINMFEWSGFNIPNDSDLEGRIDNRIRIVFRYRNRSVKENVMGTLMTDSARLLGHVVYPIV